MSDWYFAYGSNMNPARMEARGLGFKQRVRGSLEGFGLRFNKRAHGKTGVAYANIVYAPEEVVEGALYQLEDASHIRLMDPFEGAPVRYSRECFWLDSDSGPIAAWVYVANSAMIDANVLPEDRYLAHLLEGRDLLSASYSKRLESEPCIPCGLDLSVEHGLKFNH